MDKETIAAFEAAGIPEAQRGKHAEVRHGTRNGYDVRAHTQVPLDMYYKRDWITERQYRAGNRLHRTFHAAGIFCPRGMRLTDEQGKALKDFSEMQQAAREEYDKAIASISGMIGKLMVANVCCYGEQLKGISYLHYDDSKARMARFREAMDELVEFYKRS